MNVHTARKLTVALGLVLFLIAAPTLLQADVLMRNLKIEKVLDSSAELGDLAESPNGHIWLLERASGVDEGTIRVFVAGKEVDTLAIPVKDDCESGLLDVAFSPDYDETGLAFLYYVNATGQARVDQVFFKGGELSLGSNILQLGTTVGGCCPGGGIDVGPDYKLYVSVGDLEVPANAQAPASLAGKVLRTNLDGSNPGDNPSGTRVWATGFRNGKDLDIDTDGNVYLSDLGDTGLAVGDELDEATAGGNFGWPLYDCDDNSDGLYDDPLRYWNDPNNHYPEGLVKLTHSGMGEYQGSLIATDVTPDELREFRLAGTTPETVAGEDIFYDPDGDADGTPDAGCPAGFDALMEGNDGWLYGANSGANPGVWRIYHDDPGPREVSAEGSPFHLTVGKSGNDIVIGWENLGPLDAGRPLYNAGQYAEAYQIWEGSLPISGSYDHTSLVTTDGTADGPARLTWTGAPSGGDHYYIVSAQGDNMEGSQGTDSSGNERVTPIDYCDTIGWGYSSGDCIDEFRHPTTGEPMTLTDYNLFSPTFGQALNLSDFRGKVMKIDISALNCYWCGVMAEDHGYWDEQFRGRDLQLVTVMMSTYNYWDAIAPADCNRLIRGWAISYGETGPILCDTDLDSNGYADVADQLDMGGCGTPQNIFVDQGHVIYDQVCGAIFEEHTGYPPDPLINYIDQEINPETCE
jgi:hypothetical protein